MTRSVVLILCVLIAASSARIVNGQSPYYNGYSTLSLQVSSIVTQSPIPYAELRYVRFDARALNFYQIFDWFLLGTATRISYMDQSLNMTQTFGNRTEIIGQMVHQDLDYSAEVGPPSPRFELAQRGAFTYTMGFLFATSLNLTFQPEIHLSMFNRQLENDWVHEENWERSESPPMNQTLRNWGLSPQIFWNVQNSHKYRTFYLYEISLSKPSIFVERMQWTFEGPAILLFVVLISSLLYLIFGKLGFQEALTLYLGSAFFSLPFLLSYLQLGLGSISTAEMIFRFDIYFAMLLALVSLAMRLAGKKDDESATRWAKKLWRTRTAERHAIEDAAGSTSKAAPSHTKNRSAKNSK